MNAGEHRIAAVHPLTPLQQGLLFESLASSDPALYAVQVHAVLGGELDARLLARAWDAVQQRHPALRADFDWEEFEEPVQVVDRGLAAPLGVGAAVADAPGAAAAVEALLAAERRRGFRLSQGPLSRLVVVPQGRDRHHLIWTYHHLLLDGWSMLRVLAELFAAHAALRSGGAPGAVAPALPFSEYVAFLRGRDLEAAAAAWRRALGSFREPTPLPTPLAGEATAGGDEGAVETLRATLAPQATASLRAFCRRHRLTLATVVEAAWAWALGRFSGEEDVVFGLAVAERPAELNGADTVVGLCLNTVPVRIRLPGDGEALAGWLAGVQAEQLALRPHAHAPLARIQGWSGVARGRPLFDSLVVFENHPAPATLLPPAAGLELLRFAVRSATHYGLTLTVTPGSEMAFELACDRRRVGVTAAARMLGCLRGLLAAFGTGGGTTAAGTLPLLPAAERQQLLREWNDSRCGAVPPAPYLHRLVEAQAAATPEATAVVCGDRWLSYGELDRRAGRLGRRLAAEAPPGLPVGVCVGRSEEIAVALLAVLKAGRAYLPLDPDYPPRRLAWMLEDAGVKVVVTGGGGRRPGGSGVRRVTVEAGPAAGEPAVPEPEPGPEDAAYRIYTSGSSGRPKAVEVPHAAVVNFLAAVGRRLGLGAGERLVAVTTPCFDISVLELFGPLSVGARVVVAAADEVADGVRLAALLARAAATAMQATPASWRLLLASGWRSEPGLKLLVGGEALDRPLADALLAGGGTLFNLYGPTEATVWSLVHRVAPGPEPVVIGRPLDNTAAYLLDRRLRPVPAGVAGALYLGGAGVARGYAGSPRATAESFLPDPYGGVAGARMYRTGDLARARSDGVVEFLGRLDHQVKIRGFRVEPAEVETALRRHPAVAEAVVVARGEDDGERRLVAYWTAATASPPSLSELRRFLAAHLAAYLVPAAFVRLESLPRTRNGKLDRRALPDPGRARPALAASYVAPRTAVEKELAAIWAAVLAVDRVGVEDDFFELGGDSIRSFQVAVRARRAGLELTPRQLFSCRTIAELTAVARPAAGRPPAPRAAVGSAPAGADGGYPLTPMQQGMLFHTLLAPGSAVYFEQLACTFEGRFRPAAFERAWARLAERHPILQSAFVWRRGELRQVVDGRARLPWRRLDWRRLGAAARRRRLQELIEEDRRQGFDLARAPLMRHTLIRLAEERWRWLWSFHHALLDGWSLALVAREALALYAAFCRGVEARLPEPPPYGEYVAWLGRQDRRRAEAFWRRRLGDLRSPTVLEVGRPAAAAAATGSDGGYRHRDRALPAAATAALTAAARARGLTLATHLYGAWSLLLSRYSGAPEVVFGFTSSGRPAELPGAEAMVGLLVSTLPARVKVPAAATARHWLEGLQAELAEAREYESSALVDVHGWSGVPRGTPLFETIATLESYPRDAAPAGDLAGVAVGELEIFERTNYPLSLMAIPGGRLTLRLLYERRRFDDAAIGRMLGHLATLLAGLAAVDEAPLGSLPMLTPSERHQLLVEWPGVPAVDGPTVAEPFCARAAAAPEAVAVVDGERCLTYGELRRRAAGLGRRLARRGLGPEGVVALVLPAGLELVVATVAAVLAGAAYLPLDPEAPDERLRDLLRDAGAGAVFGRRQDRNRLARLGPEPIWADGPDEPAATEAGAAGRPRLPGADPRHLAYVIYTSGSAGRPKGVAVEHAGLAALVAWHRQAYRVSPEDRASLVANPAFDASVWEVWPNLASGASLHVPPPRTAPPELAAWLAAEAITVCFLPTPLAEAMLELPPPPELALRLLLVGGDRLRRPPAPPPGCRLVNHYGPTESSVVATAAAVAAGDPLPAIGRPIAGTRAHVLDRRLRPVPTGVAGELCLAGVGLARGYLGRPDQTARSFVPDPWGRRPGGRLYRTGDRVRYRGDGELEFLGRYDRQVKLRGLRIEPGEVEAVLGRHPAVAAVAVVPRQGRNLAAYVVPAARRTGRRGSGEAERRQVERWRQLYDETYRLPPPGSDPEFNLVGWQSSYTGRAIPESEMRQWVEATVERILALEPRRVLEIGAGTGLLLYRVAPRCQRYWATDFSRPVLEQLGRRLGEAGSPQVTLLERAADDFQGLGAGGFDLVILNSVAQYFPDLAYLERVVSGAARIVRPGGAIFVGDVRNLELLEAFHASVERRRAPGELPAAELRRRVRQAMAAEEELVVHPRYFRHLAGRLPEIGGVEIQLKRGRGDNELVRFRYDVVLKVGPPEPKAAAECWLKGRNGLDLEALGRWLAGGSPRSLVIAGVPDARVGDGLAALAPAPAGPAAPAAAATPRPSGGPPAGVEPEDVWELGRELGYAVEVAPSAAGGAGRFDAFFHRPGEPVPALPRMVRGAPAAAAEKLANDPLAAQAERRLAEDLEHFSRRWLAPYMVPATFTFLAELPLSANGKIDRDALPPPPAARPPDREPPGPPPSPLAAKVAALWAEVLGLEEVGLDDGFFELGGHSLAATRLVYRLREAFAVELPLRRLFAARTVRGVAAALAAELSRRGGGAGREPAAAPLPAPRRAAAGEPFALTPVQAALYRARRQGEGANVCFAAEGEDASGDLAARLAAALDRLAERHPMLRAVVGADGRQRIRGRLPRVSPAVVDLRRLGTEAADAELAACRRRLLGAAQDPGRWPLFDFVVHRLDGGRVRLSARFDGLVMDGASRLLVSRELSRVLSDPAATLEAVAYGYREYAEVLAQGRQGTARQRAERFWRRRLADLPPPPEVTARGVEAGTAALSDRWHDLLAADLWSALRRRAAGAGVTPSALALTAFAEALGAIAARTRFLLGVVSSHRPPLHPRIYHVVGNFTDLLLVAVDGGGGPFRQRAQALQQQLAALLEHRELSGFELFERLGSRQGSRRAGWPPVVFASLLEFAPELLEEDGAGGPLRWRWSGASLPGVALAPTVAESGAGGLRLRVQAREEALRPGLTDRLVTAYRDRLVSLAESGDAWDDRPPVRTATGLSRR